MKKKSALWGVVAVLVALVLIVGIWAVATYNGLVNAQLNVENAFANVDTALQRRSDLIPNLVNTVKGYAAHEEEVFTAVADARTKLNSADTAEGKAEANGELSSALSRLLMIVERYPDLKASEQFIGLQDELAGTENRIKQERDIYNKEVKTYNAKLRRFPSNIIAGLFGFEQADSFQADEGSQTVPNVSF